MENKTCTFFGHRDCPETIKPKIREAVIDLIENHGVTMFYVGNQGNFDRLVLASGDRDHILSGVFNQFLSEKSEPAE